MEDITMDIDCMQIPLANGWDKIEEETWEWKNNILYGHYTKIFEHLRRYIHTKQVNFDVRVRNGGGQIFKDVMRVENATDTLVTLEGPLLGKVYISPTYLRVGGQTLNFNNGVLRTTFDGFKYFLLWIEDKENMQCLPMQTSYNGGHINIKNYSDV